MQLLKDERQLSTTINIAPPLSRRGDSKDRPTSVRSSSKEDKAKTNKTGSKNKKEAKEEKHEKPGKGKKEEKSISKKAAALADVSKANSKIKGRSMRPSKAVNQMETMSDVTDGMENKHPLLSKVDEVGPGKLLIQGNFVLLLLNLARNRVTEEGLSDLYKAVEYQSTQLMDSKVNGTGLVKLFIQRNKFNPMTETSQNIQQLISNRDRKTKTPTVDE